MRKNPFFLRKMDFFQFQINKYIKIDLKQYQDEKTHSSQLEDEQ